MAIGQYPEGAYRLQADGWVTRGSGRVSDVVNPAVEWLLDRSLSVKAVNYFSGSFARAGQILAGVDVIASIKGQSKDEMGYNKPVLTICNGLGSSATDANGYVRAANMTPAGTFIQHCYNYYDDRLMDRLRISLDRSQYLMVPYIKDPYYADSTWVGCATGGNLTSAGGAALNPAGAAYNADARIGANFELAVGDYVQSDYCGHFMKWVPDLTSATTLNASLRQKIGQVLYIEEVPMRGLLQTVMLKATNGIRRMYSDYDFMQPYPIPSGQDARTFLQSDKSFWPSNYGEIDEYGWPSHLKDFMGIPGLTDGARMATKDFTEDMTNVALDANSYHTVTLTHHPIARSEEGASNPASMPFNTDPNPSKLTVQADLSGLGTFLAANTITLSEWSDYVVNRNTGVVCIRTNKGTDPAATDAYRFTYKYLHSQVFGIPTNADWQGSVGLVYIATQFNR